VWGVESVGVGQDRGIESGRCGSKGGRGRGGREGEVEEEGGSWHCFWHLCFSDTQPARIPPLPNSPPLSYIFCGQ
jgi:hypothetical protein